MLLDALGAGILTGVLIYSRGFSSSASLHPGSGTALPG